MEGKKVIIQSMQNKKKRSLLKIKNQKKLIKNSNKRNKSKDKRRNRMVLTGLLG